VGLRCVELQTILDVAQEAQLTAAPNPSYRVASPKITRVAAEQLLSELGVEMKDAVQLGKRMRSEVEKLRQEELEYELS
jgi:hypothetical protein